MSCSHPRLPGGALLAAVFFFWIYGKEDCLAQVNLARQKASGRLVLSFGQVRLLLA